MKKYFFLAIIFGSVAIGASAQSSGKPGKKAKKETAKTSVTTEPDEVAVDTILVEGQPPVYVNRGQHKGHYKGRANHGTRKGQSRQRQPEAKGTSL